MNNRTLLIIIAVGVLAIGAYLIHEENESPAEKVGESIEEMGDSIKDATN